MKITKQQRITGLVICASIALLSLGYTIIHFSKQRPSSSSVAISPPIPSLSLPKVDRALNLLTWTNLYVESTIKYEEAIWHMSYYLEKAQEEKQIEKEELLLRLKAAQQILEIEYNYIYSVMYKERTIAWGKRIEICFMRRGNIQRFTKLIDKY